MTNYCLVHPTDIWDFGSVGKGEVNFKSANPQRTLTGNGIDVESELHRLADGGTFIDSRSVPFGLFSDLVIRGPMLGLDLPSEGHRKFTGHETLRMMKPSLEGAYKDIANMALNHPKWSSLDTVGLDIFIGLHAQIGSRIGRRVGNSIHWKENGLVTVEPIRPCQCWKDVCVKCQRLRHYVDPDRSSFFQKARAVSGPDDHCPECRAKMELPSEVAP